MSGVSKEQIRQARDINLFAYLQSSEPGVLKRDGSNYRHREHDSLVYVTSKDYWYWNNLGKKINALDYLIEIRGYGLVKAVNALTGSVSSVSYHVPVRPKPPPRPNFSLPWATLLLWRWSPFWSDTRRSERSTCIWIMTLPASSIENIFENSDFIYMLNQAQGDRQILVKQLGISPHQLSYVTHSGPGEGLLFFGNVIIPFVDRFPKDTTLYKIMTTRPDEMSKSGA